MTVEVEGVPWAGSIVEEGATEVSAPVFAQNVAAVAEYRGSASEVDEAFEDESLVETAEVIAGIMWAGLAVEAPAYDAQLRAVLERSGRAVEVPVALRGTGYVLEASTGRLGVSVGGGMTVESTGDALAIVEGPPEGRYVRAWEMPRVVYGLGGGEPS